jgi:hypothetical protein
MTGSVKVFQLGLKVLIQVFIRDISVSLCIWQFLINQGAFRQILRNMFWRVCIFLILVDEAATQMGKAYVKSGLIIEVYRRSDDLICSVDL